MGKKKKNICPVCGKEYEFALRIWQDENGVQHCEHDNPKADRLAAQRRLNEEASVEAMKLAQQARMKESMENPMVEVSPPPGSKGRPMKVPKRVVESIKEKITPEIEKLE